MSQVNLTVIGSLNYDLVTFTPRVPEAGETIKADVFEPHTGGKGFNEAIALARLLPSSAKEAGSHKVRMIGKVGKDAFGNELLDSLKKEKVDVSEITIEDDVKTGVATILVEHNGENRILITAGANDKLRPTSDDFEKYFPKDDTTDNFVMLQNEFPFFVEAINWLKTNRPKHQIAYNPSPIKEITSDYLQNVDLLIVNEIESTQILFSLISSEQKENIEKSEKSVNFKSEEEKINFFKDIGFKLTKKINKSSGSLNLVIITLGALGVIYITSKEDQPVAEFLPSQKVPVEKVVDTTGAGDTFFGSVVSQLSLSRNSYYDAIKFATIASSLAIQKKGAGESIPTYELIAANE